MKSFTITICIFTNLIVLGMFGYFYLLLSQYWSYWNKHNEYVQNSKKNIYDKEIYYYNRGYPNESSNDLLQFLRFETTTKNFLQRNSRQIKYNDTILIKDSKPRFVNLDNSILELDTTKYTCHVRSRNCTRKTALFKHKLTMELQRILMKESDIFNTVTNNRYNVNYEGVRENFMKKSPKELVCQLRRTVTVKTITRYDPPFNLKSISKYFQKRTMFHNKHFNTCAVIASAGSLLNSNLGEFIDSHDLVLRFNHAPTLGYEKDVGSKTTVRILNSQVVTKPEYNFLTSDLFKNVTILVWDPMKYTGATLEDWYREPDHPFFDNYMEFKARTAQNKLYLLNPKSLWSIWDFLQSNSLHRLRKNPPSSGFLALTQLLSVCTYIDVFEYIPSVRITSKCHYFDKENDRACTFGAWHPLAGEKLIALALNFVDDFEVFQKGYIRIPGFSAIQC